MTDYIIDSDELDDAECGCLEDSATEHIRSRTLEAELKKERERIIKIIHSKMKERYVMMEDAGRKQQYAIMISFIKSLRSEP